MMRSEEALTLHSKWSRKLSFRYFYQANLLWGG